MIQTGPDNENIKYTVGHNKIHETESGEIKLPLPTVNSKETNWADQVENDKWSVMEVTLKK